MQVHTGGQVPPANLFDPVGVETPVLPIPDPSDKTGVKQINWSDVQDIFGHFKDGEGDLLLTDGRYVGVHGGGGGVMPARCNKCHNTAFVAPPVPDNAPHGGHAHAYSVPGGLQTLIQGKWALNGIQCEQCHGPGSAMEVPSGQVLPRLSFLG